MTTKKSITASVVLKHSILALTLALTAGGCSFSMNSGSLSDINPFRPALKWAPTNAPVDQIRTLAIVVAQDPQQSRDRTASVTSAIVSGIEQEFTQAALNKGYQLVGRERIAAWKKEIEMQNLGLSDPSSVARAGKMLNASHLLIATPNVFANQESHRNLDGRSYQSINIRGRLDCQILEIETSQLFAACSDEAGNSAANSTVDSLPLMSGLAKRIAKALPPRSGPAPQTASQGVPNTR